MEPSTLSLDIIYTAAEQFLLLKVVCHVQLVPRFVHCHSFDTTVLVQAAKFSNERQTLLATINRLIAGGPAQNAGWTGTSFSHRQGTAGTSSAAQAPSAARAGANGEECVRCSIPMEPVSGSLTSILSCWKEYKYSTADRPSIRRLIDDHGTDWHSSKYKYYRKKWNLKKRIISAVEAIQSIKQMSSEEAVNLLEKKRDKSVNLFAQSLPTLSDEVDVSGKCRSSSGKWRPLRPGDHLYDDIYSVYLDALRNKLGLRTNMM
jgi:hypothetical protein